MNDIDMYWSTDPCYNIQGCSNPNVNKIISRIDYWHIIKYLRFEDYNNQNVNKTYKAWKIKRIVDLMAQRCREMLPCPDMVISVDEGMIQATQSNCPIGQHVPYKPIKRGVKVFEAVDHRTKVIINFHIEDGIINAENSREYAYGATGRHVIKLIEDLPGEGYEIYTDNYYGSLPLAAFLLNELRMHLISTLRVKRGVPNFLKMTNAKAPKPTIAWPKGNILYGYCKENGVLNLREGQVYIYSYMDSSLVYFMDTVYGPNEVTMMSRKNRDGTVFENQVPKAIARYNSCMGGVDTSDQIRNAKTSFVMDHSSKKWTIRVFLGMIDIAYANAYNIYRMHQLTNTDQHGFKYKYECDLARAMCDYKNVTRPEAKQGLGEGGNHRLQKIEEWTGEGKNRRRIRYTCSNCPHRIDGKVNKARQTTFHCPECGVYLHETCFAAYHKLNGYEMFKQDDETTFITPIERQRRRNS